MRLSAHKSSWSDDFQSIVAVIAPSLTPLEVEIIHIGSTSIPGAVAKPIIDIDIVAHDQESHHEIRCQLETIGYKSRGELGVAGRESFLPPMEMISHHLYVVSNKSKAYLDHVDFKSALLQDPFLVEKYNDLKLYLEPLLESDRVAYTEGKTQFITEVLANYRRKD